MHELRWKVVSWTEWRECREISRTEKPVLQYRTKKVVQSQPTGIQEEWSAWTDVPTEYIEE